MTKVDKWSIDKLNSSNWTTWKFQMKHLLLAKGLWEIITGEEVLAACASDQQAADFKKRSRKAFSTIVMSIDSLLIYLITSQEQPTAAWKALCGHQVLNETHW